MKVSISLFELEQAIREYVRKKGIQVDDNAKVEMEYTKDYDETYLEGASIQIKEKQT